MRPRLLASFIGITLAIVPSQILCAAPPAPTWQDIHDKQPKTLHVELSLPKDHYFQGEQIDATVNFSSDAPNDPHYTNKPVALLEDSTGQPGINPFKWQEWRTPVGRIFKHFVLVATDIAIQGYSLDHPFSVKLTINEHYRFDQPGTYTLYTQNALSSRDPKDPQIDLVSNKVTFTITSLAPEQEKAIIAESTTPPITTEKFYTLIYLQTPAAREALINLIAPSDTGITNGLLAAPDPSVEASKILAAVKTKGLMLSAGVLSDYAEMKASHLMQGASPDSFAKGDLDQRVVEIRQVEKAARTEIAQAIVEANPEGTPRHLDALWLAFTNIAGQKESPEERDSDGGIARKALANEQLNLSNDDVQMLFRYWPELGSADFLPLIDREAKNRTCYYGWNAILMLAQLNPDKARSLIIAEISRPDSSLFNGAEDFSTLPPMPLPELDDVFRKKLASPGGNQTGILALINLFGTSNLLPDVRKLYLQPDPKHPQNIYSPNDNKYVYLFWLRCDPQAATADFKRDLAAGDVACWFQLWVDLRDNWNDAALPLLCVALKSGDADQVADAVYDMKKHVGDDEIETMITALERFRDSKDAASVGQDAVDLLAESHLHFTDDQKKRLKVIASLVPK